MEHFIKNIEITNFKSIRHAEIKDCRRVNVFVGYPNVGKSNILEALGGFTLISNRNDVNIKDLVRFQEVTNLFHNADTNTPCEISYDGKAYLQYQYKSQDSFHIGISNPPYNQFEAWHNDLFYEAEFLESNQKSLTNSAQKEGVESLQDAPFLNLPIIKKYSYKDVISYKTSKDRYLIPPDGENLKDIIEIDKKLRNEISQLLGQYKQKLLYDKSEKSIRILTFLDEETIFTLPIELIADTLRRLIFYKAVMYNNKKTVLLLEEPESHMFPPYISKITSDIIYDDNSNQFFLATHSPFVLNDLMEDLKDDELSIYAVGLSEGQTVIRRLTDENITEIYQYGVDLFFNLEDYLKDAVSEIGNS